MIRGKCFRNSLEQQEIDSRVAILSSVLIDETYLVTIEYQKLDKVTKFTLCLSQNMITSINELCHFHNSEITTQKKTLKFLFKYEKIELAKVCFLKIAKIAKKFFSR